jgi:hypothetical protein
MPKKRNGELADWGTIISANGIRGVWVKLRKWAALLLFLAPLTADGQDVESNRNPLDVIQDKVTMVLADAGVPFTTGQERSIALVLEESRRASEQLFGDIMDFRDGPPQGAQLDRARAGIDWMNDDFSRRVREILTEMQLAAWDAYLATRETSASGAGSTAGTSGQVQEIRINNNPFTAESQFFGQARSGGSFGFSGGGGIGTEIFQRGGAGAYHGSYEFRFRDESLNARNPFSRNKAPYQQRSFNVNTSGPVIRNRLTLDLGGNQSQQDNAGAIQAETVDGPFELGFTRPAVSRSLYIGGTYQIQASQSADFRWRHGTENRKNQGIGGFNLPERAYRTRDLDNSLEVRHLWSLSGQIVQDISFEWNRRREEREPETRAVTIDVLGAFGAGGNPVVSRGDSAEQRLRALWIRTGERRTFRFGGDWNYESGTELNENNYLGTFEFSSLATYKEGRPAIYRVTRGDPALSVDQHDVAFFIQSELRASSRLTLFFGLRHEIQSTLKDYNNLDPRFSAAYALGASTVLRAGIGLFHTRVQRWVTQELQRLDGQRQYQIVISDPSFPEAFDSGDVDVVPPPSRRVAASDLAAPYQVNASTSLERSMARNTLITASLDYHRSFRTLRSRDLNAPLPGTPPDADGKIPRPDTAQGAIWQLESSGMGTWSAFQIGMRQRLKVFNLNARYTAQMNADDSNDQPFSLPANSYGLRDDVAHWTRHQFNATANSRLPMDVYLTASITLNSGNPYSVTTGRDDNGDGVTNDRPAGERRNGRYGPGSRNVDVNISKAFVIGRDAHGDSTRSLNLSASMNNAFNSTNLGNPVSIVTSNNFGKSISANNPREIELSVRFQF